MSLREQMETAQNVVNRTESERLTVEQNGTMDGMYISLSQAAKLWGKSKNTLSVDLSKGKLQWVEHQGKRSLMMGQLAELYGPLDAKPSIEQSNGTESERPVLVERTAEINGLRAVLQSKEEQIALLKEQLDHERLNAERWHTAYEQVKMLPAPKPATKPGFLSRMFGRTA